MLGALEAVPERVAGLAVRVHERVGAEEQREGAVRDRVADGARGAAAGGAACGDVDEARHEREAQRERVCSGCDRRPPRRVAAAAAAGWACGGERGRGGGTEGARGEVERGARGDGEREEDDVGGGLEDVVRAVPARGCGGGHSTGDAGEEGAAGEGAEARGKGVGGRLVQALCVRACVRRGERQQ